MFKTETKTNTITAGIGNMMSQLPITKHLGDGTGETLSNSEKMKKGEKAIYSLFRLIALGAVAYGIWVYALPIIFTWLGRAAAVIGVIAMGVLAIVLAPAVFKRFKRWAKAIHKGTIRQAPFEELDIQKKGMEANRDKAYKAHGNIKRLRREMEKEAKIQENKAKDLEITIQTDHKKAVEMQTELQRMVDEQGIAAKSTDGWVELNATLRKHLSESTRDQARLKQASTFVSKYGTRANMLKKASHKLTLVEVAMDNKVEDFKATIEILQNDYNAARKLNDATSAAKEAMLFDTPWELDFAIEVVATSIAEDLAVSTKNFNDIDSLTVGMPMDNDEMFAKLDRLAGEIEGGMVSIPSAADYSKENYKLTQEDKINSGGFDDIY
jgi:hypothetical protein